MYETFNVWIAPYLVPVSYTHLLCAGILLLSPLSPAALAFGEADVVHLRTVEDLERLAQNCTLDSWSLGKTIYLESDLHLAGTEFTPIPTFGGTFEGQGHTISGLSITGSGNARGPVSYTHLDVYKRQGQGPAAHRGQGICGKRRRHH